MTETGKLIESNTTWIYKNGCYQQKNTCKFKKCVFIFTESAFAVIFTSFPPNKYLHPLHDLNISDWFTFIPLTKILNLM